MSLSTIIETRNAHYRYSGHQHASSYSMGDFPTFGPESSFSSSAWASSSLARWLHPLLKLPPSSLSSAPLRVSVAVD